MIIVNSVTGIFFQCDITESKYEVATTVKGNESIANSLNDRVVKQFK